MRSDEDGRMDLANRHRRPPRQIADRPPPFSSVEKEDARFLPGLSRSTSGLSET